MSEIKIRTASENDGKDILKIYEYYVRETAISFEIRLPQSHWL